MDKKDEDSLKKFEAELLPKIGKKINFESFMKKIKNTQDVVLKKRKRIRIGRRGKQKVIAGEWIDIELIDNINLRSKLSRTWRVARKQGEQLKILKLYEEEYKEQQRKTSIMSGGKKVQWEIRKIEEIIRDGKKFWNVIRELLGKNKERHEETFVYSQEGEKKNIEETTDEYMDKWKK